MTLPCCGAEVVGITPVSSLGRCVACGENLLAAADATGDDIAAIVWVLVPPWTTRRPVRQLVIEGENFTVISVSVPIDATAILVNGQRVGIPAE